MSQPPAGHYAARGTLPTPWEAVASGGQLKLVRPGEPDETFPVTVRAFARGIEFEGESSAGRVTLSLTSENACNEPPGYAATLLAGGKSFKGCAAGLP